MTYETLVGIIIGSVGMAIIIFLGLWVAQFLDRSHREMEIQARLNRAIATIERNEMLLQSSINENSKLSSDLNFMRKVCGASIEQTLAYFEQTPAIFGDRNREKIIAELHETLVYTGRSRVEPIALLEHMLTNGGEYEQSSVS